MRVLFNDNEPYVQQWLKNLYPEATVLGDSISDLDGSDLDGYDRVHLFAGIGGWEYALKLAGWPSDVPVWTGSCPCQPFSVAGKQGGESDERHLWPDMLRLVSKCSPSVVFGEQVASSAGRDWLSGVRTDLEALGYEVGAADLCAASVGAPSIRQRIFWVANLDGERRPGLVKDENPLVLGQWDWRGEEDLHVIASAPFSVPFTGHHSWPKPLLRKMDDGVPNRMGRLRAYGNAIVPQVAAAFIRAFMETQTEEVLHGE